MSAASISAGEVLLLGTSLLNINGTGSALNAVSITTNKLYSTAYTPFSKYFQKTKANLSVGNTLSLNGETLTGPQLASIKQIL